jgi:hypothetical protein
MRFDIVFGFSCSRGGPHAQAQIRRFLRDAPQLLRPYSKGDIDYEVVSVDVSGFDLYCQLNVAPSWPAAARLTDAEMIRMGIQHPTRTRATTALLLWIASMHGLDPVLNPLISAWREFTGDSSAVLPVAIATYDYRVSRPSTSRAYCRYDQPVSHKNDSMMCPTPQTLYDGTTKTRT